jgi:hypothetical protein
VGADTTAIKADTMTSRPPPDHYGWRVAGSGLFPPEVFEDVRRVARRLRPRPRSSDGAGLGWLWLLLLIYPFSDYVYDPLRELGVPEFVAARAFIVLDAGIIVAVLLSRGDAAGARFFGLLSVVLDVTATDVVGYSSTVVELVYDVLYTLLLIWVLAHIFRDEPLGRLLTAPIVIGAFVGYLAFTIPGFVSSTELETLLASNDGVTYYNAAASVIPVFLIALSLEGGWLTDVEGDSPLAIALRHGLRLVTILVLAIAQAAAIGAMLAGGGSPLAYQVTVEAMAVGFTAIFVMLHLEAKHERRAP